MHIEFFTSHYVSTGSLKNHLGLHLSNCTTKTKTFSGCSSTTVHIIITYIAHNMTSVQCDSDLLYDFIHCCFPFLWLPLYRQVTLLWFFVDLFPFLLTFYVSAACLVQLNDYVLHLCHFRTPQLLHLFAHLLMFCTPCTQGLKSQ